MRRPLTVLLVALASLVASGNARANYVFTVTMTNANEPVTVVGRPASSGTVVFAYNDTFTSLSFSATVFNIYFTGSQTPSDASDNLTNAHIHAAAAPFNPVPGQTAGVVWGFFGAPFNETAPNDQVVNAFTGGLVGGTISGKWDPTEGNAGTNLAAQLPNLLAGRAYINFHTTGFSGGEIRAFLTPIPEPSSIILLGIGTVAIIGCRWRLRKR